MAETELSQPLVIGTRGSKLAHWQADWVRAALSQAWPALVFKIRPFTTSGDRQLDLPLAAIGGKGLFTAELEQALHDHEIDLAVHSLKDLPTMSAPGLALGAIGQRTDARDVLIAPNYGTYAALPRGARVGTSSPRRVAQLLAARPDLSIWPLRGNVDTRVRKAENGEYDAVVLAAAGVQRLGLSDHIREYLPLDVMLPAPGQGAIGVQCRAGDERVQPLLRPLDHAATREAVTAERTFLARLGGGCAMPIAAYATSAADSTLKLMGLVASPDGQLVIRVSGLGADAQTLGAELAAQALAQGAQELLG